MSDVADLVGEEADSKTAPAPLDMEDGDGAPPGLFAPRAIDDGSQCLLHDGFDVHAFERAAADYGKLGEAVAALRASSPPFRCCAICSGRSTSPGRRSRQSCRSLRRTSSTGRSSSR
jgi:hypothetical protein